MTAGDFFESRLSGNNAILKISLEAAVPLWIAEIERAGGPSDEDYQTCRDFAGTLAEKGDRILYRSKVKGETAQLFNALARSIAVMAFCPGGIRLFGMRWEARPRGPSRYLGIESDGNGAVWFVDQSGNRLDF